MTYSKCFYFGFLDAIEQLRTEYLARMYFDACLLVSL
jgi:hypothetical protein